MHYIQLVSVCAPCVKHTLCCRLNETGKLDNRFTLHSQLLNISLQSHMMPWWGQNDTTFPLKYKHWTSYIVNSSVHQQLFYVTLPLTHSLE